MPYRTTSGVLVDQRALAAYDNGQPGDAPASVWTLEAYRDFISILVRQDFPCLFGKRALKSQTLKFLFISEMDNARDLIRGMLAYTRFVRSTPLDERLYSPLIVVFQQADFVGLAAEHLFCWNQLQILHDNDPADWPLDVPTDPSDSQWSFCFDGVQLFFNMNCPHHDLLRNRQLGKRIVFIVNPRKNFDAIANLHSDKGVGVRQTIRERVRAYNHGDVPSELGFFGDPGNLEWKQYLLTEPGAQRPTSCPLAVRNGVQNKTEVKTP